MQVLTDDVGCTAHLLADHTGALAAVIHLLRSPSHQLQQYGEAFMRHHYHLRQPGAVQVGANFAALARLLGVGAVGQFDGHSTYMGRSRKTYNCMDLYTFACPEVDSSPYFLRVGTTFQQLQHVLRAIELV